ncbi:uncharacterized protein LOC143176008 [Nomia melanderi]|uniref:uncharacterized protein LOC143176008 n=1 Tax=Nomia melanderi TaxID=2448451 RepID=UPI003FCEC1DD
MGKSKTKTKHTNIWPNEEVFKGLIESEETLISEGEDSPLPDTIRIDLDGFLAGPSRKRRIQKPEGSESESGEEERNRQPKRRPKGRTPFERLTKWATLVLNSLPRYGISQQIIESGNFATLRSALDDAWKQIESDDTYEDVQGREKELSEKLEKAEKEIKDLKDQRSVACKRLHKRIEDAEGRAQSLLEGKETESEELHKKLEEAERLIHALLGERETESEKLHKKLEEAERRIQALEKEKACACAKPKPKALEKKPSTAASTPKRKDMVKSYATVTMSKKDIIEKGPTRHVVTVYLKDNNSDWEQTRKAMARGFRPTQEKLQVKAVKKISKGGLLVETATKEGLQRLINNKPLQSLGLKIGTPPKKKPKMVIYNVPDLDEKQLLFALEKQNGESISPEAIKEIKPLFKTGKGNSKNWVIEVSPKARKALKDRGRLFLEWQVCHVRDYVVAGRCFRCQAFGHIAKHCRAVADTCGHCAQEGHSFKECPNTKEKPSCINCKRRTSTL